MKVKVSELIGAALDWAVAKVEGGTDPWHDTIATWWITLDYKDRALRKGWAQSFCPSTDWAHGGPILDKMFAEYQFGYEDGEYFVGNPGLYLYGPTSLVAAMRCLVASELGNEIEVPDELVGAVPA